MTKGEEIVAAWGETEPRELRDLSGHFLRSKAAADLARRIDEAWGEADHGNFWHSCCIEIAKIQSNEEEPTTIPTKYMPLVQKVAHEIADAIIASTRLALIERCAGVAEDGKYDWCETAEGDANPCFNGTAIAAAIRALGREKG